MTPCCQGRGRFGTGRGRQRVCEVLFGASSSKYEVVCCLVLAGSALYRRLFRANAVWPWYKLQRAIAAILGILRRGYSRTEERTASTLLARERRAHDTKTWRCRNYITVFAIGGGCDGGGELDWLLWLPGGGFPFFAVSYRYCVILCHAGK